jgi:hypothetical protein
MDLEFLGDVAAINASLNLLVADGSVAARYDGAGPDNERAIAFLTTEPYMTNSVGRLPIASSDAMVVSLQVMSGMASVFRVSEAQLVVMEPCKEGLEEEAEEDPDSIPSDFLEQIAAIVQAPPEPPAQLGEVEISSGVLVLGDCYDSFAEMAEPIRALEAANEGAVALLEDHLGSLAMRVRPGRYRVERLFVELDWAELGFAFLTRQ